ncbi:MAG TPA: energy-coupling factor transporter transmembrane component T [Patescibacteria group bacterium]
MKKSITAVKLVTLLVFNWIVFSIRNPLILSILFIILLLLLYFAKAQIKKRLLAIIPIGIAIIIFQLIFYIWAPFTERFLFGFIAAAKIIIISLSVLTFLSYTSLFALIKLFDFLPEDIMLILMITAYLIPTILSEAEKIQIVQKSRNIKTNSFSSLAAIIIPLLHRVFQRAETISLTILARGYKSETN